MDKNRSRFTRLPKHGAEVVEKIGDFIFISALLNNNNTYEYEQAALHIKLATAFGRVGEQI